MNGLFAVIRSIYNKTIISFGYVISRIIKLEVRIISASVDNSYLDLDYSGYRKSLIQ